MSAIAYNEFNGVIHAIKYQPCVSVIFPFEPKMGQKAMIDSKLHSILHQIRRELLDTFPDEKAYPVIHKLQHLIKDLNYNTHKKSIAIFVSPLVEKVYYLDIPVEEKIIINESFEIRDLIYSKKEVHKYLLLVLSSKRSSIYLGNTTQFMRIVSNVPEHAAAFKNDISERSGNFSDPSYRKEVLLEKFLHHTDSGLGIILNAYSLPLFVMGTDRTIGHFKKISTHSNRVLAWIPGNYEEFTQEELRQAVAPYVTDWKKLKQDDLLQQVDSAQSAKKLAIGINEVFDAAASRKGRLLVVEKNFMYPFRNNISDEVFVEEVDRLTPFYIKDAVDDIMEKVLENGGDVEFVDEGLLADYNHIVLIQYY